ncbi:hypothetical protein JL475_38925 [Streptomyces sp. M2CJ-2]|nr:hypothetical protein [Streptomyces sp. M2CJ-2]MBL3671719.1 hypothetical protein [Streptomyces sp. M2CJ-2]
MTATAEAEPAPTVTETVEVEVTETYGAREVIATGESGNAASAGTLSA